MSAATMRAVEVDEVAGQPRRDLDQRDVDRDRHDREQRRPDHHDGVDRRAPSLRERAEIFGMAGKGEAGFIEGLLGDRVGHDRARGAGSDISDRALDQFDRRGGEAGVRLAGTRVGGVCQRDDGSARSKTAAASSGRPGRGERRGRGSRAKPSSSAGRGERKKCRADLLAGEPRAQQQLRADARRDRPSSSQGERPSWTLPEDRPGRSIGGDARGRLDVAERAQRDLEQERLIACGRRRNADGRAQTGRWSPTNRAP